MSAIRTSARLAVAAAVVALTLSACGSSGSSTAQQVSADHAAALAGWNGLSNATQIQLCQEWRQGLHNFILNKVATATADHSAAMRAAMSSVINDAC
jgi:hypothetical protein